MIVLLQKNQSELSEIDLLAKLSLQPGIELYGQFGGAFGSNVSDTLTVVGIVGNIIIATNGLGERIHSKEIDGRWYTWSQIIKDSNDACREDPDYDQGI